MLRSRSQLVCRIGNITTNCSMLHVANCCLGVKPPLATKQPTRFFQLIYFSIKFLKLYLGFNAFLLLKGDSIRKLSKKGATESEVRYRPRR
jgi:hypothetical protein